MRVLILLIVLLFSSTVYADNKFQLYYEGTEIPYIEKLELHDIPDKNDYDEPHKEFEFTQVDRIIISTFTPKETKRLVEALGKKGHICKVHGHRWVDAIVWTKYENTSIDGCNKPNYSRACSVCDKEQILEKSEPKWIDVEKE